MTDVDAKFIDIHPEDFPFKLEGIDADTDTVLWSQEITGPGAIVIPGRPDGVREIAIRVTYADGLVLDTRNLSTKESDG